MDKLTRFLKAKGSNICPTIIIPDSNSADSLLHENKFESRLYNDMTYYSNKYGIKVIIIKFADITDLKQLSDICNSSTFFMIPKRSRFGTTDEILAKIRIFDGSFLTAVVSHDDYLKF